MADQKLTALSELSVPALEDLLYLVDDPSGTPASVKATIARALGFPLRSVAEGRLTTQSGVPISTADRTSQGTIYYTPYAGTRIALYDGTRWALHTFTERSLALSSLTSGKAYDVFLYDNAGTLTLELSAAWTNDTTRADALTTQDGVYVKSGATTRRWVGTIYTTGTATTEDSLLGRYVWNADNRVPRKLLRDLGSSSHTYNNTTVRTYNNATAYVSFVSGLAGIGANFGITAIVSNDAASPHVTRCGIGENSGTTLMTGAAFDVAGPAAITARVGCTMHAEPQLGFSYYSLNQSSSATGTHTYDFGRVFGMILC